MLSLLLIRKGDVWLPAAGRDSFGSCATDFPPVLPNKSRPVPSHSWAVSQALLFGALAADFHKLQLVPLVDCAVCFGPLYTCIRLSEQGRSTPMLNSWTGGLFMEFWALCSPSMPYLDLRCSRLLCVNPILKWATPDSLFHHFRVPGQANLECPDRLIQLWHRGQSGPRALTQGSHSFSGLQRIIHWIYVKYNINYSNIYILNNISVSCKPSADYNILYFLIGSQ